MKLQGCVIGFILLGVAAALFGFYQFVSAGETVEPVAVEGQPVALATATMVVEQATAVPTIWATPTINEAATVAQINLLAADKNLVAAGRQATAIVEAALIESQASDRKSASDERLAQQAIALQKLINDGKNIEAMMMSFAVRRDEIHLAFEQLEQGKNRIWGDILWPVGLIFLSVGMVVTALLRQRVTLPVAQQAASSSTLIAHDEGNGWDRVGDHPEEITVEQIYYWLKIALNNQESLSVDEWEKRHNSMFTSTEYRIWHRWLNGSHRRFLAGDPARRNMTVLSDRGRKYFIQSWMSAHPLPYPSESPKYTPVAAVSTGPVVTEAEGEGLG